MEAEREHTDEQSKSRAGQDVRLRRQVEKMHVYREDETMIAFGLILAGALCIEHWFGFVLIAAGVVYVCAR